MPTTIDDSTTTVPLLALVDFKWLMAGEGHRIDVGRLCQDGLYAKACLALARGSASPTLRHCADQLGRQLARQAGRAAADAGQPGPPSAHAAMAQGASGP